MSRYHFSYPLHPTLSGDLADQVSGGAGAWAALHPEAVHTCAEQLETDATERVLEAGDFMYLPASFVHQVTAETDSLSVTVCMHPVPSESRIHAAKAGQGSSGLLFRGRGWHVHAPLVKLTQRA